MAKRSDFAQKLLDDLRLRKERMAAAQSSGHSYATAGDAYGFSQKTFGGNVGSKIGNVHKKSNGANRSLTIEEASKQIVPFGKGRNSEQIVDLSMALAFALQNGGNLRKMDSSGASSVLGFLHQIGRRSVDFRKTEKGSSLDRHRPSTSHFPTLSHLHIKEISKGAQKLNQILRACSNGINFDKYSIEIGKELLKGAMDLEESLRMLVNLQEASEYMISPQRKSQIRLIEVDEDDDENTAKITDKKQLDRPRFSFDKPSRNSRNIQEVARTGFKQRLAAIIYPTEASDFNQEKHALTTSNSVSHKRSASCGPAFKSPAAFTEQKKHSSSSEPKSGRGRIPNVIARLMGLEELPDNVDSKSKQKESTSRQKIERTTLKKAAQGRTINAELKSKNSESFAPQSPKQQTMQAKKIPETRDTSLVMQAEKNLVIRSASFDMVVQAGKPPWKELESVEGIKLVTGSRKAQIKMNKQQSNNITNLNQITGNRKDIRANESRQDNGKHMEQKGTEKGETKEPSFKDELLWMMPQTKKSSGAANILQEKTGYREIMLQTEKRYANRLLPSNQKKPQNDLELQQLHMLQQAESQEEKCQAEETEKQFTKQNLQLTKQKRTEAVSKISPKPILDAMNLPKQQPHMNWVTHNKRSSTEAIDATTIKGLPDSREHEELAGERSCTNLKVGMKDSTHRSLEQNASPRDQETESEKAKAGAPQVVEEKPNLASSTQKKVDNKKLHRREIPRKIDEVMTRKNGTPHNLAKPLKSNLQETKQRREDRANSSKRAERDITGRSTKATIKSNESEEITQPLDVAKKLQNEGEKASTLKSPREDKCQSLNEPQAPASDNSCQIVTSSVSNDKQGQATIFGRDQELKIDKLISSPLNGAHEGSMDISYPSQLEHQKISESWMQKPLTENENHLKQILTKSQLFLNTAEALFKLNIPVGILHASGHTYQYEDSMLILDCSYEVMKKRGRRLELTVHPCINMTISCSMKVRSLDDLVKQLHKDIENLRFYGRDGNNDCDAADYLYKMLERDVQNRDPDVNSMWDLGWNETVFTFLEKDEVIRDVERHMLNGLIDELTREFLYVSVSV